MTLTKAGEDVFGVRGPDSHRLPHSGRENAGNFDGWGKDRHRLCLSTGRSLYPAPGQALLEQPENQKVVFNFWQNHTPAIAKKVKTGELDVGFGGCLEKDDMEFFPVANQKLVIITPKDHPLAERESIPFAELNRYPVIGYDKDSWMGDAHPRALCEIQHPAGHHCGVSGRIFDRRAGAGEFWHRTDAAHGYSGAFSGSLHSSD